MLLRRPILETRRHLGSNCGPKTEDAFRVGQTEGRFAGSGHGGDGVDQPGNVLDQVVDASLDGCRGGRPALRSSISSSASWRIALWLWCKNAS
jgi:hypothetical protein